MSLDLTIQAQHSIVIEDFIRSTREIVSKITQVETIPEITVMQVKNGKEFSPTCAKFDISPYLVGWTLTIKGEHLVEIVAIDPNSYFTGTAQFSDEQETISYLEIGVTVRATRHDSLKFVLGAACAAALAYLANSTVIDEGLNWSETYQQTPENFLVELQDKWPSRIQEAARAVQVYL